MINKKYFLITLTILLIASLGVISATDVNDTTDIQQDTTTQTTPVTKDNTIEKTVTEPTKNINETKIISKTTQTNTKEATQTVTNYTELYDILTDNTNENLTVTLEGDDEIYNITSPIIVNETIKNLTIEGNGKTINGNNTYMFLIIEHLCNLNINNLTVTNCTSSDISILYPMGAAITVREGNTSINNSKFYNNTGYYGSAIYAAIIPTESEDGYEGDTYEADYDNDKITNLQILNSEFESNYALISGGASATSNSLSLL